MQRVPGTRWRLYADVMTARGPALGTDFAYSITDMFGIPNKTNGDFKLYGIHDTGNDQLGGGRGEGQYTSFVPQLDFWNTPHPEWRGRLLGQLNMQELPMGLSVQSQVSLLSDRNFLEQFFQMEFQRGLNQETYFYAKQQQGIMAWDIKAEPRLREWVTEAQRLPEVQGYLIGQKFLDLFTYNSRGSAGYYHLIGTSDQTGVLLPTDQNDATGRFDWGQEISLPFQMGAFKLVPYATLDLTYYTQDLAGEGRGRFYGGGGMRGSIPFSKLYPDVCSELLNLNGIFHKIVVGGNYYIAHSDTPYTLLPQLDRIHDDATDQAMRDIRPFEPIYYPGVGTLLPAQAQFDPQSMAVRRLVMDRIDTLGSINTFQFDVRQRWQTKRGYLGQQHIVDWMTLDLSASFFPNTSQNFGSDVGFLEYDWNWNVGDRTALFSSGFFEPFQNGAHIFSFGGTINRPDKTNVLLMYRQIDPLNSKTFVASITYPFSSKYALTFTMADDVGNKVQTVSAFFAHVGSDVEVDIGFSYSSALSTFSFLFQVYPNLLPASRRMGTMGGMGSGTSGGLMGMSGPGSR